MYTKKQASLHVLAELEAFLCKPGCSFYWRRKELESFGVKVGKEFSVGRHFYMLYPNTIMLGERAALGDNVQIVNHAPIEIGDDFLGANNLIINSGTHDPVTMVPRGEAVRIGKRVWCGVCVIILAGVTIGDDVVIGAGSVVTENIPSNSVAVGVPTRVVRTLDRSELTELWTWAPGRRIRILRTDEHKTIH